MKSRYEDPNPAYQNIMGQPPKVFMLDRGQKLFCLVLCHVVGQSLCPSVGHRIFSDDRKTGSGSTVSATIWARSVGWDGQEGKGSVGVDCV